MDQHYEIVRRAWRAEREEADQARGRHDRIAEWRHLERAHILSQPLAVLHVRSHLAMLNFAARRRDGRELVGQMVRLLLAAPGSVTGRYPVGNTGGSRVGMTEPMPIPADLLVPSGSRK